MTGLCRICATPRAPSSDLCVPHRYRERVYGTPERPDPIPLHPNEGVSPERLEELRALSWPALVAWCDEVRAGTVDALLRAFLAAWREP